MLKRWRAEIIAFAVAIALGVGVAIVFGVGQTSESDRVAGVAKAYLGSFAANDPVALCNVISPAARVALEFQSTDCATPAKTAIQKVPAKDRAALGDASVTVEKLTETDATVKFSPKLDGRDDMHLIKRNSAWFVNP